MTRASPLRRALTSGPVPGAGTGPTQGCHQGLARRRPGPSRRDSDPAHNRRARHEDRRDRRDRPHRQQARRQPARARPRAAGRVARHRRQHHHRRRAAPRRSPAPRSSSTSPTRPRARTQAVLDFFQTSTATCSPPRQKAGWSTTSRCPSSAPTASPDSGYLRGEGRAGEGHRRPGDPLHDRPVDPVLRVPRRASRTTSTDGDTVRLPHALVQPIAADDVAARWPTSPRATPSTASSRSAGPSLIPLDELARRLPGGQPRPARRDRRPDARYFGAALDDGSLNPGPGSRLGSDPVRRLARRGRAAIGGIACPRPRLGRQRRGGLQRQRRVFWCGRDLMAITVLHEGRLHLRIDPRRDGQPWLLEAESLRRRGRRGEPAPGGVLTPWAHPVTGAPQPGARAGDLPDESAGPRARAPRMTSTASHSTSAAASFGEMLRRPRSAGRLHRRGRPAPAARGGSAAPLRPDAGRAVRGDRDALRRLRPRHRDPRRVAAALVAIVSSPYILVRSLRGHEVHNPFLLVAHRAPGRLRKITMNVVTTAPAALLRVSDVSAVQLDALLELADDMRDGPDGGPRRARAERSRACSTTCPRGRARRVRGSPCTASACARRCSPLSAAGPGHLR